MEKTYDDTLDTLNSTDDSLSQLQTRIGKYKGLCEDIQTKTDTMIDINGKFMVKIDDMKKNPSKYSNEDLNQIEMEQKELEDMLNELQTLSDKKTKEEEEIKSILDDLEGNVDDVKSELGLSQEFLDNWNEIPVDKDNITEDLIPYVLNITSKVVEDGGNEELSENLKKIQSMLPDAMKHEEFKDIMLSTIKKRI